MKSRLVKLLLAVLVLVIAVTLALGGISCAEKEKDITGKWRFTLTPVFDLDNPEAKQSQWEVTLYDYDGTIVGVD